MGVFRKLAKYVLESLTGLEVERFGPNYFNYFLYVRNRKEDAWFSYRAQVRYIFEKYEIDLVIDVGANKGQFARNMRSFYSGDILSFEPVSSAFEKLAAAASSDPKWQVYKLALGSQDSTGTINVSGYTEFSSLLKTNDYCAQQFGPDSLKMKEEVINVRRLDKLLDVIISDIESKRIFMKMDTQGYDLEVFKGLGSKIQNVRALQSEVSLIPIYESMPPWIESIATYEKTGFGVVGMFPVNRDSGRVIEYDCLMTKVGL